MSIDNVLRYFKKKGKILGAISIYAALAFCDLFSVLFLTGVGVFTLFNTLAIGIPIVLLCVLVSITCFSIYGYVKYQNTKNKNLVIDQGREWTEELSNELGKNIELKSYKDNKPFDNPTIVIRKSPNSIPFNYLLHIECPQSTSIEDTQKVEDFLRKKVSSNNSTIVNNKLKTFHVGKSM